MKFLKIMLRSALEGSLTGKDRIKNTDLHYNVGIEL